MIILNEFNIMKMYNFILNPSNFHELIIGSKIVGNSKKSNPKMQYGVTLIILNTFKNPFTTKISYRAFNFIKFH